MELTDSSLLIVGANVRRGQIEWTVKQYAAVEGVTERTVWSWISKGAVNVRRTPGGRVRVVERLK